MHVLLDAGLAPAPAACIDLGPAWSGLVAGWRDEARERMRGARRLHGLAASAEAKPAGEEVFRDRWERRLAAGADRTAAAVGGQPAVRGPPRPPFRVQEENERRGGLRPFRSA